MVFHGPEEIRSTSWVLGAGPGLPHGAFSGAHGQQMGMPLSPGRGEWFAQLTLDKEQKQAEDDPRVSGPQQVLLKTDSEVSRPWIS